MKSNDKINKVYKFSRFNPDTARKINNIMLNKTREQNRYLIVLNRVYEDLELEGLKATGTYGTSKTYTYYMNGSRKDSVKSTRELKLRQEAALTNYREVERKARSVERANEIGDKAMKANNIIRVGFKQIDNMTPGQLGLRKMIKNKTAIPMENGMFLVKKQPTPEEKIKATGLVKENKVVQFVISEKGKLVQQDVVDGKVQGTIHEDVIVEKKTEEKVNDLRTVVEEVASNVSDKVSYSQQATQQTTQEITQEATQENQNKVREKVVIENVTPKEMFVQHVVNTEGQIIKQVVDAETNEIKTEQYVVLNKGVDKENLIQEMAKAMTKEELELPRKATVEDKVQKFEGLLESIEATRLEENAENLLGQVLEASTEEEKELDEIIAISSLKANNTELKYLDEDNELGKRIAIGEMVRTGVLTSEEASDDDIVGDALDVLNKRIEKLSEDKSDILFDKALEMDYVKSIEEDINIGEATPEVKFTPQTSEEKVENLSELLKTFARNRVEEITSYPSQVIDDTVVAVKDTIETEKNYVAEAKYEKALEEAEKKWAKVRKTTADTEIVSKIKGKKSENENETVKITLNFYGNVETQGEAITLSNRYTIKDFYDKAHKLDSADLNKTQIRFLKENGSKLDELQLSPFSFSKCPVEEMDDWNIYVMGTGESLGEDEIEEIQKNEEIEESTLVLFDKYYIDIKNSFIQFIDDTRITSFDDLHTDVDKAQNLYRRLSLILRSKGEKNNDSKAKTLVDNIHKDLRFKNILKEKAKVIIEEETEKQAEELLKKAKQDKANQYEKLDKEKAEERASRVIVPNEVFEEKKRAKDDLLREILDEASKETEGPLKELMEIRSKQTNEKPKAMRLTYNDISKGI